MKKASLQGKSLFNQPSKTTTKMKISVNREQDVKDVSNITVIIDNVGFKISVNKFDELIINKIQYGDGDSSIIIKPAVSNEIRIS